MIRTIWLCKNDLFAASVSAMLRAHGISIVTVTSPEKAKPYFQAIEADLIIIDANWDAEDHYGISLLAGLRQASTDIKAIFVTTNFQPALCKKLEDAGAMGYFFRNSGKVENIVYCIKQVYYGATCYGETDPSLTTLTDELTEPA